jgi:hypothetical protein
MELKTGKTLDTRSDHLYDVGTLVEAPTSSVYDSGPCDVLDHIVRPKVFAAAISLKRPVSFR